MMTMTEREWDRKYGEGNWAVGYVVDGAFVLQENVLEPIYNRSYEEHFAAHPEDLEQLIRLAKSLRNPHAEATTGVDLQVPAILTYLERHGRTKRPLGYTVVPNDLWGTVNALREISPADKEPYSLIFRDVFGNPFRPVVVEQTWLTARVVALAQRIYDNRAFDRLPVLAVALEEAGCDNAEILSHCRGPGPHVRGCWALDLILGKE
jgi:hypothetical protein